MERQQGFATIITVLLVILISAGLGAGAYFGYNWWQEQQNKKEKQTTPTTTTDPRAGWLTYTDAENGFSLKYPPDWTTKEGTPPASTRGTTLKDIGFIGTTDKVFVTVRTNPDADLETFVRADGVTGIQPAKVDKLDGFAGVAGGSYRVYLGKEAKVFMFTFPGAKANTDLSPNQVNLLTSFAFTSGTSGSGGAINIEDWLKYAAKLVALNLLAPAEWGTFVESITPGETGRSYNVSFESGGKKYDVIGSGRTVNFSTGGRGDSVLDVSSVKRNNNVLSAYLGDREIYSISGYETIKKTKAGEVSFGKLPSDTKVGEGEGSLVGVVDLIETDYKVLIFYAPKTFSADLFKAFLGTINIP